MKRILAALVVTGALWCQAPNALFSNSQAFEHYDRIIQLMESTTVAVPGLARAAAPVLENTKQSLETLRRGLPQNGALHYSFLVNARAYIELADALPKPYPFPKEGLRQFAELREAVDRADSHFRALLDLKETQLRNPDRDNLKRYAEDNVRVGQPASGSSRVVFLGDSITDGWRLNEYFPGKDYVNRGISGQITGQMLGRMQADVINLKPSVMVVLAGTNDIARGVPLEAIENNLTMIASLAEAAKIKVVFASVLPVHDYNKARNPAWEMTRTRPMETIRALNQWISGFCAKRNCSYLDYFTAMTDPAGFLKQDLAEDGLHPNAAGYRVMAPLASEAIAKALPGQTPPQPKKEKKRFPF